MINNKVALILEGIREWRLSHINLAQCNITDIPDLTQFEWVTHVDLSNNKIQNISKMTFPPNVKKIKLSNNDIRSITNCNWPLTLEKLDVSRNKIKKFDGRNMTNLKVLCAYQNAIDTFCFPLNAYKVDISHNELKTLNGMPTKLSILDISYNEIQTINFNTNMNYNLHKINFAGNCAYNIPLLPESVISLNANDNLITQVNYLPHNLQKLKLSGCKISNITCELPKYLHSIDLSDNYITEMPKFPENITKIDLSNNMINYLGEIPKSVNILNISGKNTPAFSTELLERDNLVIIFRNGYNEGDDDFYNECDIGDMNENDWNDWNNINDANDVNDWNNINDADDVNDWNDTNHINHMSHIYHTSHINHMSHMNHKVDSSGLYNNNLLERLRLRRTMSEDSYKNSPSNPNYISIKNIKKIVV